MMITMIMILLISNVDISYTAMTRRRVAVVGAGVSGLSATKACLDESLDPVCFEMRQDLGKYIFW